MLFCIYAYDILWVSFVRSIKFYLTHFLCVAVMCFHHHLLKPLFVLHQMALDSFVRSFVWLCFWALCSVALNCSAVLSSATQFWLLELSINLHITRVRPLLCSLLCLVILAFLSQCKLYSQFINIHSRACWDFDWKSFESIRPAGKLWHLGNIIVYWLLLSLALYFSLWIWHVFVKFITEHFLDFALVNTASGFF